MAGVTASAQHVSGMRFTPAARIGGTDDSTHIPPSRHHWHVTHLAEIRTVSALVGTQPTRAQITAGRRAVIKGTSASSELRQPSVGFHIRSTRLHISACRTKPDQGSGTEDLGLLGSRNPRYGVESILAPFMRQAGLCTTVFTENVRICRVCGAALCPLRCVRREAAVVSGRRRLACRAYISRLPMRTSPPGSSRSSRWRRPA